MLFKKGFPPKVCWFLSLVRDWAKETFVGCLAIWGLLCALPLARGELASSLFESSLDAASFLEGGASSLEVEEFLTSYSVASTKFIWRP